MTWRLGPQCITTSSLLSWVTHSGNSEWENPWRGPGGEEWTLLYNRHVCDTLGNRSSSPIQDFSWLHHEKVQSQNQPAKLLPNSWPLDYAIINCYCFLWSRLKSYLYFLNKAIANLYTWLLITLLFYFIRKIFSTPITSVATMMLVFQIYVFIYNVYFDL